MGAGEQSFYFTDPRINAQKHRYFYKSGMKLRYISVSQRGPTHSIDCIGRSNILGG